MLEERTCRLCKQPLPLTSFPLCGNGAYRSRVCLVCDRAARKRRREKRLNDGPRVPLVCSLCGKAFDRPKGWRQPSRSGKAVFCHNPCRPSPSTKGGDELSPFRRLLHHTDQRCRSSARGLPRDIDPPFLLSLWKQQDGLCPITGRKLTLPKSLRAGKWRLRDPYNASIDRIDQTKGYVQGNVRFVALIANLARHVWDDTTLYDFATALVGHRLSSQTGTDKGA